MSVLLTGIHAVDSDHNGGLKNKLGRFPLACRIPVENLSHAHVQSIHYLDHHQWSNTIRLQAVHHEVPRNIVKAVPVSNGSIVDKHIESFSLQQASNPVDYGRI